MADPQVLMELGFNLIYLVYIIAIVTIMLRRWNTLPSEIQKSAKWVVIAFSSLLIGDIGHVGARLIVFFSPNLENPQSILGIGTLLEMIGLIWLFIFWLEAWRQEFQKPKNIIYWSIISIGIIGLIIFVFPQNQWSSEHSPYAWLVIRNLPWLIQGVALSILLLIEGKIVNDKRIRRIGVYIFSSFFFYMPVIFAGHIFPMLGMLMIPGTVIYMIWQGASVKRFFPKRNSTNEKL